MLHQYIFRQIFVGIIFGFSISSSVTKKNVWIIGWNCQTLFKDYIFANIWMKATTTNSWLLKCHGLISIKNHSKLLFLLQSAKIYNSLFCISNRKIFLNCKNWVQKWILQVIFSKRCFDCPKNKIVHNFYIIILNGMNQKFSIHINQITIYEKQNLKMFFTKERFLPFIPEKKLSVLLGTNWN